jgi:hypothetical protein
MLAAVFEQCILAALANLAKSRVRDARDDINVGNFPAVSPAGIDCPKHLLQVAEKGVGVKLAEVLIMPRRNVSEITLVKFRSDANLVLGEEGQRTRAAFVFGRIEPDGHGC